MISRRDFVKWSTAAGAWLYVSASGATRYLDAAYAAIPGGSLDPTTVPKYATPLLVPPVMPKADTIKVKGGKNIDYYEISVRQFQQQILPAGFPATTVWGYGAINGAGSKNALLLHNAPSLTIEARAGVPTRIKWINDLKDAAGNFLPHILPVDPTLHWCNPGGGTAGRDTRPDFAGKSYVPPAEFTDPATQYTDYDGPVPFVTHVHGAVGVADDSDGYAEAWFLPAANNIPATYASTGTWYDYFKAKAAAAYTVAWAPGSATFQYPNANRASTIWYHDHALGMTRLNVYAGPAGFYIVRGGAAGDGAVLDSRTGLPAVLPGPAPKDGDKFPSNKTYYEIPIAIQDRAFNVDGSLFYPSSREFFDGATAADPGFIPGTDLSPVWNPEFFGNAMMINGATWPSQTVEQKRYRFRFLNGCSARFLIMDFAQIPGVQVWQIGNEGGFLGAPVDVTALGNKVLLGLAERADVIVDFTNVPAGNYVLGNVGPDEPFKGFNPDGTLADGEGGALPPADPATTGQIMQFAVVPAVGVDPSTPGQFLTLPAPAPLPAATVTRPLALLEEMSMYWDGPAAAMLGRVDAAGIPTADMWMDPVTENPAVGTTEVWEFYNFTADAHPMHVHEVTFEVVNREALVLDPDTGEPVQPVQLSGNIRLPEPSEIGFKDTVTAYPGEVTRIRAQFNTPGQFVWHCHIVDHEDNEMMRPYRIGPADPAAPSM
jgi:FtsP/CotA-like multicopper oxidase with cupredoxin domain